MERPQLVRHAGGQPVAKLVEGLSRARVGVERELLAGLVGEVQPDALLQAQGVRLGPRERFPHPTGLAQLRAHLAAQTIEQIIGHTCQKRLRIPRRGPPRLTIPNSADRRNRHAGRVSRRKLIISRDREIVNRNAAAWMRDSQWGMLARVKKTVRAHPVAARPAPLLSPTGH